MVQRPALVVHQSLFHDVRHPWLGRGRKQDHDSMSRRRSHQPGRRSCSQLSIVNIATPSTMTTSQTHRNGSQAESLACRNLGNPSAGHLQYYQHIGQGSSYPKSVNRPTDHHTLINVPNSSRHVDLFQESQLADECARFGVGAAPVPSPGTPWRRVEWWRGLEVLCTSSSYRVWGVGTSV